jgi:guanine deaminase
LENKVGNFVEGKEFDAIIVDLGKACGNPAVWYNPEDALETLVERFLFGGDNRNIKEVYVCGRLIGGTSLKAERRSIRRTNTNVRARL